MVDDGSFASVRVPRLLHVFGCRKLGVVQDSFHQEFLHLEFRGFRV